MKLSLQLNKRRMALMTLLALFTLVTWVVAQDPPPPIVVNNVSPSQLTLGQTSIMVVSGANFRATTKVALVGVGDLPVTLVSPAEIRAAVPGNLTAGQYIVSVTDSQGGANSAFTLNIVVPPTEIPPTNPPAPTDIPPIPTAIPIPTDIPGAPSLLIRSFTANPATIKPGDTTTFTFDVINQGSRTAQGVSVAVDPGGKFVPANGQANVLLPDLAVGAAFSVRLAVVAAKDTPDGPQTVGLTMSYRDFSGTVYTSKGSLTVNVTAVAQSSQITLARYQFDPSPVIPGEPVTVTILLTNTGNETASQVLVSIPTDGILLAGPEGNSFPVGDIEAGQSASVDMPLIVGSTAKAGPQSQNVAISYIQKGETKTVPNAAMTLNVARVDAPAPVMIVDSFQTGFDVLTPGQEFTLTLNLRNIGNDQAKGLIVTFGGVDSSGGGIDPTPGADASTTTNPSSTFAPVGSVGTQNVGDVPANKEEVVTLTQSFIVSGSVESGIYPLPITLRYQRSDGSFSQDNLRASLPVIVPPQIRVSEANPMPEQVNAGDMLSLSLEIANRGRKAVNFTNAVITAENAEISSGETTYLGPVRNDDQTTLDASFLTLNEGQAFITVTLNYTDDLNRPQTIVQTYNVEVLPAPPPIDFGTPPPDFGDNGGQQEPEISSRDLIGRVLLGLLGLGS
ncbi:MAG: hypothetical protein IT321_17090 [Anaerolineae bacterium]|nr:hypothetical protein [Anaerolineae bacterium]